MRSRQQNPVKPACSASDIYAGSRRRLLLGYRFAATNEVDLLPLVEEDDVSIRRVGESADFPHLLEHLIADLQCTLTGINGTSAAICGWKNPGQRFDLFIESDDSRIGVFAACFGANLVNNFLAGRPGEDDYGLILQIARLIDEFPETKDAISKLALFLNESVENLMKALMTVAEMNFFQETE
jgi:hypothetical protein